MDVHGWRVSAAAVIIIFCVVLALGNGVVGIIDEELQETNRRQQHYHHNYCCRGLKERAMLVMRRPFGPGSSPPTCRFRCGRCSPCVAVHVAIQPGVSRPLDYYPEAWRCRCRNKYFMP